MRDNLYNQVMDKVLTRIDGVSGRISSNFKGVAPFDKQKIPNDQLMQSYNSLNHDDILYLIERHGRESVNQFIYDMESKKMRFNNAR